MTAQQDLKLQQTRDPIVVMEILDDIILAKLTRLTDREIQKAKVFKGKVYRVN